MGHLPQPFTLHVGKSCGPTHCGVGVQLPVGSHAVRLCYQSGLGDNGEVTADCFVPHAGTDERPGDRYLSVHWLEYLGRGPIADCLQRLRDFLLTSKIPGERKPTRHGKLAVLSCDRVSQTALEEVLLEITFWHVPRLPASASGVEIASDGSVRFGIAHEQAAEFNLPLDPHSGLFTLPEAAAHEVAVQQFLASQVVRLEPGRLIS